MSKQAPPHTKWRNGTLYTNFSHRGRRIVRALGTADPRDAARRVEALRNEMNARQWGEATITFDEAYEAWNKAASDGLFDR